jgi:hypothetical protein
MVALARRLDMAEFNAKNEAALLSTMAKGYDYLTHSTGGVKPQPNFMMRSVKSGANCRRNRQPPLLISLQL